MDCKRLALSKKTGEVVWQAPMAAQYQSNPVVFNLPVGGDAGKREAFLLDQRGQVLRARDGKVVATGIGSSAVARPWPVQGDIAVVLSGAADGGGGKNFKTEYPTGWNALRLKAESADKVTAELLWSTKNQGWCSVIRDGVFYQETGDGIEARDLLTGTVIGKAKADRGKHHFKVHANHQLLIAGDHIFAFANMSGGCSVFSLGSDGRSVKPVACNVLGDTPKPTKGVDLLPRQDALPGRQQPLLQRQSHVRPLG